MRVSVLSRLHVHKKLLLKQKRRKLDHFSVSDVKIALTRQQTEYFQAVERHLMTPADV